MLSKASRLRSSRSIREVGRRGIRVNGPGVVVHARRDADNASRFAVAVGKSVGGSVERHRLARQLREAVRPLADGTDGIAGAAVLIRALPDAKGRGGADFQEQVREAVLRAMAKAGQR